MNLSESWESDCDWRADRWRLPQRNGPAQGLKHNTIHELFSDILLVTRSPWLTFWLHVSWSSPAWRDMTWPGTGEHVISTIHMSTCPHNRFCSPGRCWETTWPGSRPSSTPTTTRWAQNIEWVCIVHVYSYTGELRGVQDEGQVRRRHPWGLSSEEVKAQMKSITAMYFNDDMLRKVRGNNGPPLHRNREHKNIKC